jgi:hypothetical protein
MTRPEPANLAEQGALFSFDQPEEDTQPSDEVKNAWAEATHLRDMWMRLLKDRDRWADGVRAASERRAREQAYGLIVAALPDTLDTLRQLARTVLNLPETPAPSDLKHVRQLAELIDTHDPRQGDEVRAIAAIQTAADEQIKEWQDRSSDYWNQNKRTREEILAADDTYLDLVSAGWKAPAWRVAKWRAAQRPEPIGATA